jgi:NAD-dependent SIR2 family protein deacetylase
VHWLLEQSTSGGDEALQVRMITQNVDGLLPPNPTHTIEAHGRVGLYKCIPDEDSDTDSESDDDDGRLVHLGHRRKWRRHRRRAHRRSSSKRHSLQCPYQNEKSVSIDEIEPSSIQENLKRGKGPLSEAPKCPYCNNTLAPQALLFDEGYHSHDFYEFQKMEEWLAEAEVIVFVGTSFAVRLPEVTLEHARAMKIPV